MSKSILVIGGNRGTGKLAIDRTFNVYGGQETPLSISTINRQLLQLREDSTQNY
jgi:hypothetical protein